MQRRLLTAALLAGSLGLPPTVALPHQPVMDMAPRWANGYGFQVRHEVYGSDKRLDGSREVANPQGLERHVRTTWLEGVYTFDRSLRVTAKLPFVDQERKRMVGGTPVREANNGLGDIILAMPLKQYKNEGNRTGNLGFTPQIRVPTGDSSGDYPLGDGSWDLGLSFSLSKENPSFYQFYDLFYWINGDGRDGMREGNVLGFDMNLGIHPYHSDDTNSGVFLMLDVAARDIERPSAGTRTNASGGQRIHAGPVIMVYRQRLMARARYSFAVHEDVDGISLSRGDELVLASG